MPDSINFIQERRKLLIKERVSDRRLLKFALIGFVLVFFVAGALIITNVFLSRKIDASIRNQKQLESLIKDSRSVELEYAVLLSKLKIVSSLFGDRKDKQDALAYFNDLFDDSVMVSGISYTEDDRSLAFSLDVPSLFKLEDVLKTLSSDELKQRFGEVEEHGISRNSTGHYTVQVSVLLSDKVDK